MAPSRGGADLSDPLSEHPAGKTLTRLAGYAGVQPREMAAAVDFVNLLPEWPGEAGEGSEKWDSVAESRIWDPTGQRAALLLADLEERPRRVVVALGGFVAQSLRYWWGLGSTEWFEETKGPGGCAYVTSPHAAGTSMWWNDPDNLARGTQFWHSTIAAAAAALPRAPRKVPLNVRTRWLLDVIDRFRHEGWPEGCVDWPWVDPPGRPQAISGGNAKPAAHVVLEYCEGPRVDRFQQALHSCDRGEECVNARDLRWGTELENRLDQSARGRGDIGKVGLDKARLIRADLECIAESYGVPMDAVQRIAGTTSWSEDKWETT